MKFTRLDLVLRGSMKISSLTLFLFQNDSKQIFIFVWLKSLKKKHGENSIWILSGKKCSDLTFFKIDLHRYQKYWARALLHLACVRRLGVDVSISSGDILKNNIVTNWCQDRECIFELYRTLKEWISASFKNYFMRETEAESWEK